ncbi:MAG: DUF5131 family protein [Planctomycetota bacterium]|nr:DUF5131 family protein [Planctomycetota bacterium]
MGTDTKIQWCDRTASPWYGCAKVHTGCLNCYAERGAKRRPQTLGEWGENGVRVKSRGFCGKLRQWNREAERAGQIISVFPSLCDPFEDRPELEPWRQEMFVTIGACPWIRLILLTKRPENVRRMWPRIGFPDSGVPGTLGRYISLANVCLLTSISDQQTADVMIHEQERCRDLVPVLGVSAEPLVGPIKMNFWDPRNPKTEGEWMASHEGVGVIGKNRPVDWVIIGGESGPNARPCNVDWIGDLVRQCKSAEVPVFVKQVGSNPRVLWPMAGNDGLPAYIDVKQVGVLAAYETLPRFVDKKGGDPAEWPEHLRVREFPVSFDSKL